MVEICSEHVTSMHSFFFTILLNGGVHAYFCSLSLQLVKEIFCMIFKLSIFSLSRLFLFLCLLKYIPFTFQYFSIFASTYDSLVHMAAIWLLYSSDVFLHASPNHVWSVTLSVRSLSISLLPHLSLTLSFIPLFLLHYLYPLFFLPLFLTFFSIFVFLLT